MRFRYPIIKLIDWRARRTELENSDNPFAVVVLAHLAAQETRGNVAGRQQVKLRLVRRLYDRGYSQKRIVSLFRFIDWLLALPAAAERRIRLAIEAIEKERNVAYVTSIERIGREEGLTQGRLDGKREALLRQVRARFGGVPEELERRLAAADETTLDALLDRVIVATTVEDL